MTKRKRFFSRGLHQRFDVNGIFGFGGGDAGGGTGGAEGNAGGAQEGGQQGNDTGQAGNNDGNNLANYKDLWQTGDDGGAGSEGSPDGNPGGQPANEVDPAEAFAKHVEGLGLTSGIDANSVMEAVRNGEPDALQQAFSQIASNTYRHAMVNANKLVQQQVEKAVEQATEKATSSMDSKNAVAEMHRALPFTKDEAVAPMANAVLKQALDKTGGDVQQSLKTLEGYFKAFYDHASGDLGLPSGDSFNDNPGDEGPGTQPDWEQLLGGPRS